MRKIFIIATMVIGVTELAWGDVQNSAAYGVNIGHVHNQIMGQVSEVPILLSNADSTLGLGSFQFQIAYDQAALLFYGATPGSLLESCGWEYFTYRIGGNGTCSTGCPSGSVLLVGIAETNNGSAHPGCQPTYVGTLPDTLATLRFFVLNDRTYECAYLPIRFFWGDCTDNVLVDVTNSNRFISSRVFEIEDTVGTQCGTCGFPTYFGAQDACVDSAPGLSISRNVDYQNGGIDIVCGGPIDDHGDINMNTIPFEIADAVMYTEYFVLGVQAFEAHVMGSIAASDINRDGVGLSVADLVVLLRIITGDAKPAGDYIASPVALDYYLEAGILTVPASVAIGAVTLTLAGDQVPELLVDGAQIDYRFDGTQTRVLVCPKFAGGTHFAGMSGSIMRLDPAVEILELSMADVNGRPIVATQAEELPLSFALSQNYPNPFNPTTTITYALPEGGAIRLEIVNLNGQRVRVLREGRENAGYHQIEWDGRDAEGRAAASGVYFYRLTAREFVQTRRMLLLK